MRRIRAVVNDAQPHGDRATVAPIRSSRAATPGRLVRRHHHRDEGTSHLPESPMGLRTAPEILLYCSQRPDPRPHGRERFFTPSQPAVFHASRTLEKFSGMRGPRVHARRLRACARAPATPPSGPASRISSWWIRDLDLHVAHQNLGAKLRISRSRSMSPLPSHEKRGFSLVSAARHRPDFAAPDQVAVSRSLSFGGDRGCAPRAPPIARDAAVSPPSTCSERGRAGDGR